MKTPSDSPACLALVQALALATSKVHALSDWTCEAIDAGDTAEMSRQAEMLRSSVKKLPGSNGEPPLPCSRISDGIDGPSVPRCVLVSGQTT